MRRAILLTIILAIALSLFICPVAPAPAQQRNKTTTMDDQVDAAVERGLKFLSSQQQPDGGWVPYTPMPNNDWENFYEIGSAALATYALLESGVNPQDPQMAKALTWLSAKVAAKIQVSMNPPKDPTNKTNCIKTYEAGVLCNVYNAANRKTNGQYNKELEQLAKLVWEYHNQGGYLYSIFKQSEDPDWKPTPGGPTSRPLKRDGGFDNSNSQYGLLAVWAAAMSNVEVPKEYWGWVMKHWMDTQSADGGWTYGQGGLQGTPTMTAAGVASMFVCFDNLFADVLVAVNSSQNFKTIQRGLDWFDKNFAQSMAERHDDPYYYLYGVERVGLASGYKYFGTADWYKMGAELLLSLQNADGSWGKGEPGKIIANTSFSLLFLIRGRNAVMFNKLEYDGDWRNRSRDLAMFTKWMSNKFLENQINWQIVNLKVPVTEWHDAPILYIAGSVEPKFTPEHIQKLKDYVLQGGTIFAVTEGDAKGAGFAKGIKDLAAKMFPQYPLTAVPAGHDLYKAHYQLIGKPKLSMVHNGVRPLLISCETDISKSWQQQKIATEKWAFEAGANLYVYVTEKGKGLRPRGTSLWPEPTTEAPTRTIKIAQIENAGNGNPEPLAWERFKLLMGNMHKIKVEIVGPMPAAKLADANVKFAFMTGTDKYTMSEDDKAAIRKFVEGGGTVLIDSAGGSKDFTDATQEMLNGMFGMGTLKRVAKGSPIFTLDGMAIKKVIYRAKTKTRLGSEPNLRAIMIGDRPGIIFSSEDLTAGILGAYCLTIEGYDPGEEGGTMPGTAFQIVRNIVLTANGDGATATSKPASAASEPASTPAAQTK